MASLHSSSTRQSSFTHRRTPKNHAAGCAVIHDAGVGGLQQLRQDLGEHLRRFLLQGADVPGVDHNHVGGALKESAVGQTPGGVQAAAVHAAPYHQIFQVFHPEIGPRGDVLDGRVASVDALQRDQKRLLGDLGLENIPGYAQTDGLLRILKAVVVGEDDVDEGVFLFQYAEDWSVSRAYLNPKSIQTLLLNA